GSQIIRLKDVARVELGQQSYLYANKVNGQSGVVVMVSKKAGANARVVAENAVNKIKEVSERFPPGLAFAPLFNINTFLTRSVNKVYETFLEAFILVFIVVFIFLK